MEKILLEMIQKTLMPLVYAEEEMGKEEPAPLNLGRLRLGPVQGPGPVTECRDCPSNVA